MYLDWWRLVFWSRVSKIEMAYRSDVSMLRKGCVSKAGMVGVLEGFVARMGRWCLI